MPASSLGRPRPRPVADAPALDGARLAKAWLVELVAVAPLERAAVLPGPRFAEDAPRLCAAVAAALAGEAAFDDLEPGGTLAPLAAGCGDLTAAGSPLELVSALEALRAVAWAALHERLEAPTPAQIAELADRLAAVVATLTAAALEAPRPIGPPGPGERGPLGTVLRRREERDDAGGGDEPEQRPPRPDEPEQRPPGPDPRAEAAGRRAGGPRVVTGGDGAGGGPPADAVATLARVEATLREAARANQPLSAAAARLRALAREPAGAEPPAEELRVRRGDRIEGAAEAVPAPSPWRAAIGRRLMRHREDGLPFAVLALELADAGRLAAAGGDPALTEVLDAVEAAIVAQLRPADALVRERVGRYWLTAPRTGPADARDLGHRIARAVAQAPPHRGHAPQVAVGVAACPEHGDDAQALEERAEEALFAARASGARVSAPPA
jgi:GGDEF domain-containing protein